MARRRRASDGVEPKERRTPPANTEVRASIQLTAFRKLWECDRDIKATVAQHVTPIREERGEIWKTLRNDLDMEAADLLPLYALYKRDREVKEFDDWEKAQKSQDALREAFETLRTGQMLDFLAILGEPKHSNGKTDAEHVDVNTARAAGREAGKAGKPSTISPHAAGSEAHDAWAEGWLEGVAENLPEAPAAVPTGDPFGPKEEATTH